MAGDRFEFHLSLGGHDVAGARSAMGAGFRPAAKIRRLLFPAATHSDWYDVLSFAEIVTITQPAPRNSSITASRSPGFSPGEIASHKHCPSTPTMQTVRHNPSPSRRSID